MSPFEGLMWMCISLTRGVALGYYIAPLWGCQRMFNQLLSFEFYAQLKTQNS